MSNKNSKKQSQSAHLTDKIETYINTSTKDERTAALSDLILYYMKPHAHGSKDIGTMNDDNTKALRDAFNSTKREDRIALREAILAVCRKYSDHARTMKPDMIYKKDPTAFEVVVALLKAKKEGKDFKMNVDMTKVTHLGDDQFQALRFCIQALKPELTLVNFFGNHASLEKEKAILAAIGSSAVIHLDKLKASMFTPENRDVILKAIAKARSITMSHADLQNITPDDLNHLVTAIGENTRLQSLTLTDDHLSEGVVSDRSRYNALISLLKTNVPEIDLRKNGFEHLPKAMKKELQQVGKEAVEGQNKRRNLGNGLRFFGKGTEQPTPPPMDDVVLPMIDLEPANPAPAPTLPPR